MVVIEKKREFHVIVTGYDDFRGKVNPSFPSVSLLPSQISIPQADINIHVFPKPLNVSYGPVIAALPDIYALHPNPDLVVHVGLAAPFQGYRFETIARKSPYNAPGEDGKALDDDTEKKMNWEGVPQVLVTSLNADDVLERWVEQMSDEGEALASLRVSKNAGLYLCEFLLFASLARAWKARSDTAEENRKSGDPGITFCHIQDGTTQKHYEQNARYFEGLIKALVLSRLDKGPGRIIGRDNYI